MKTLNQFLDESSGGGVAVTPQELEIQKKMSRLKEGDVHSGQGEKIQKRTKDWMDKKGMKGAPGLDAIRARAAEHKAKRGVKEDWKPEIEHVKGSDLRKKAAEKKRKAAADSLPPHLRLDAMKKAFAHTNEEKKYPYGKATKKNPRGKRDQAELDRAQDYIKKNPDFGKKKKNEDRTDRGDQKEYERAKAYIKKHPKFGLKKEDVSEGREERSGKDNYLPFKVCYDGAEPYVLYARSVAEIKIELRKIYRPENHKKIYVKRLYPNEVIKLYYDLRQKALVNQ